MGWLFPYEIKVALKHDSLSVHEYGLKFTQLSSYAPNIVIVMRSRFSWLSGFMVYVQEVEEEKLKDREE